MLLRVSVSLEKCINTVELSFMLTESTNKSPPYKNTLTKVNVRKKAWQFFFIFEQKQFDLTKCKLKALADLMTILVNRPRFRLEYFWRN